MSKAVKHTGLPSLPPFTIKHWVTDIQHLLQMATQIKPGKQLKEPEGW